LGAEVLDRLVDPLLSGIFAGNTDRLSLLAGAPQIAAAARSGPSLIAGARAALASAAASSGPDAPVFLTLRGGLGRLVERLVEVIGVERLHLGSTVHSVDRRTGGAAGAFEVRVAAGPVLDADAVLLATPAPVAARLIATTAADGSRLLAGIAYASVTLVSFAFRPADVPVPLDGSGFLVPRSADMLMTACSWASTKFAHLGGGDVARLRVSAGRIDDVRAGRRDDGALVEELRGDLARTMGITDPPLAVRVSRWPASLPQYTVGHLDRLAAIEEDVARRAPGLVVTGAAFRGVGLPACIAQGRSAGRQILSLFR
jgi:oxygen-dependent protoporphyrinogen oxidase